MYIRIFILFFVFILTIGVLGPRVHSVENKTYDLVLIHGFSNRHQWGDKFLERLVDIWGSGHVFIVYIDTSSKIRERLIKGKIVTSIGENNFKAGIQSIEEQANIVSRKMDILIKTCHMTKVTQLVGHSMGGLVARKVVFLRPYAVANVVTIATPHRGTRLTSDFFWAGELVMGKSGMVNMTPEWVAKFNLTYPIETSPFFKNGKLYTIASLCDPWMGWGWIGELSVGWAMLKLKYGIDTDGVISEQEAKITGAQHIITMQHQDHWQLIQDGDVVDKFSLFLK